MRRRHLGEALDSESLAYEDVDDDDEDEDEDEDVDVDDDDAVLI